MRLDRSLGARRTLVAGLALGLVLAGPRRTGGLLFIAAQIDLELGDLAAGQLLDIGDGLGVLIRPDREGAARCPATPGAPDAVDIIVGMPRRVEVEDVGHALHVDPARGHVTGHENVDDAVLEAVQLGNAARLIHVAMDFTRRETVTLQALGQFAHGGLAVGENDRGADIVGAQDVAQHFALLARSALHLVLGDVGVGRGGTGHLDVLGIAQELVGQLLDRRRHGRAEQQGLALRGQLGADFLDVGDEAHVQHAVGFIDHQHVAAVEHDLAALEQVHQPPGRRDQHINAALQRLHLIAHLHAADQQRHLEIMVLAIFLEILGDLRGQFARRLQNQAARHQRAAPSMRQNVDHRQHETRRLARTRLGNGDQVAHHQHGGDGLGLDGRGRIIAGGHDRAQQFFRQAEIGKTHGCGVLPELKGKWESRPRRAVPCFAVAAASHSPPRRG
jgi:hypothetical protein